MDKKHRRVVGRALHLDERLVMGIYRYVLGQKLEVDNTDELLFAILDR